MRNDSGEQIDVINDSKKLVDAVSDQKRGPSSYPKVYTYTTNGNFTQNLLISRFVPKIVPAAICLVDHIVNEDPPGIQELLGSLRTVLPKASVTDAARSGAHIFQTPRKASRTYRYSSTKWDVNTVVATIMMNPPIPSSNHNSVSQAWTGTQEIISPRWSIITTKARNAEPLDAPINEFSAVNGHSTSMFRKLIGM